jgi:hypothetical protein
MAPPNKKQINKGFYGFESDDAEFLKVDNERGNWVASASGVGYNAKFDDDYGYERGTGDYTDSDSSLTNKLPDEAQANIRDIGSLIYSQADQPTGPITGGGGPVSDNERDPDDSSCRGSGRKGPRYSNPLGAKGQGNMRRR